MAFDFGAGVSAAGAAVSEAAKGLTLESQKAELEKEKVILADQLAGKRDVAQREFLAGESALGRTHTSSENVLQRASAKEIAEIGLKGHLASAGATVAAAQLGYEGHKYTADLNAKTQATLNETHLRLGQKIIPGENGTVAVLKVGDTEPTLVKNPDGTPFISPDPERTKGELLILNKAYDSKRDLLRDLSGKVSPLVSQINVLQKVPTLTQTPEEKQQIKQQIEALQSEIDKEKELASRELTEVQIKIDGYVEQFMNRKARPGTGAAPTTPPPAPRGSVINGGRPSVNPADFYNGAGP